MASPNSSSISSGDQPEPLVDKLVVAQHIKVVTRQVERYMAAGRIPYFKIGRSVRFRLSDVERALERYKVKSVGL